jgi:arsenate reductase
MDEITLYGLSNCDTCKKAQAELKAAGRSVTFVDIRTGADLATKVPAWIAAKGPETLVNKRSTTWRALSDNERGQVETGAAAALLIANPTLIKRPVIEVGSEVFVGWSKDISASLV